MKEYIKKWESVLLFIVIFAFLQGLYSYHFFYIEQFQLFQTTFSNFTESISYPGGFAEYLSIFFVQFFIWPFAGPAIVATFITLIYNVSSKILINTEKLSFFWIAPGTIALSCLFLCIHLNFYFQGILSFLICLIFLLVFLSTKRSYLRNIFVFISVPLLYWIAGSVSILFAVCFSFAELSRKGYHRKEFYWLLLPVFASFISFLGVLYSFSGDFRMSFLPDMYYQHQLNPDASVYISWILLIIWISVISLFERIKTLGKKYFIVGIQLTLLTSLFVWEIGSIGDRKFYTIMKLDYYVKNEQWNKIIQESNKEKTYNYLYLNYLNLALAQKGLLLQEMFRYNQHGILGLKVPPKDKRIIAALLSDISFCIGDIASSQQYAFEGCQASTGGGNGRLLKRLVQTSIIFGNYEIANKYIGILEQAWFYRDWASGQRKILSFNSGHKIDEEIEKKRRCLPVNESKEFASDFPDILERLYEINPENTFDANYLQAFYLLSKDIKSFSFFLDKYRNRKIITDSLPRTSQQALLVFYESQPDQWEKVGISDEIIRLYNEYKSVLKKNYGDKQLKEIMEKRFGSTYWFYFQFNGGV